jgi:hypothetical protein
MSPDLERLVGRAILDKRFRKDLLDDPDRAVQSGGFNLTPEEMQQVRDAVRDRGKRRDTIDEQIDAAARGSSWS